MSKTQQIETQHPQQIGDYQVQGKPIAQGGMASIFKVIDSKGKPFVAKVLHPELLRDKKNVIVSLVNLRFSVRSSLEILLKSVN